LRKQKKGYNPATKKRQITRAAEERKRGKSTQRSREQKINKPKREHLKKNTRLSIQEKKQKKGRR